MPVEPLHIQRIAVDHPVLELSDGTCWRVPTGISYLMLQSWAEGNQIKIEPDPGGEFTHRLTNTAGKGSNVIIPAKKIQEWPQEE